METGYRSVCMMIELNNNKQYPSIPVQLPHNGNIKSTVSFIYKVALFSSTDIFVSLLNLLRILSLLHVTYNAHHFQD